MEPISGIERELAGAYFRDLSNISDELRESLTDTLDYITPDDFSDGITGEMFGAIRSLYKESGELPSLPLIVERVKSNPIIKPLDYHAIIADMMFLGAVTSATVKSDRERIKQESERRAVIYELSRGLDALKDPANNPASVLQGIIHAVEKEQDRGRETAIKHCSKVWFNYLEEIEKGEPLERIPTGLKTLDEGLGGGYRPKTLNIIAARPGEGKSALMLQQARAAAKAGFQPLIFSLEMDAFELIERHYMQTIGGNPQYVTSETSAGFFAYLEAESFEVIDFPMDIDEIEAYCLRYHRKHPFTVFYIDYLGIIRKTKEQTNLTAVDFLDEISKRLKIIAKRTGAAVILLAQLNRDSSKTDEQPKLSQLRGSGGIEQNADTVSLIWNPDEDRNNRRYIKLAKNRQGAAGTVFELDFIGNQTLFREIEKPGAAATKPQEAGEKREDYSYLATAGGLDF